MVSSRPTLTSPSSISRAPSAFPVLSGCRWGRVMQGGLGPGSELARRGPNSRAILAVSSHSSPPCLESLSWVSQALFWGGIRAASRSAFHVNSQQLKRRANTLSRRGRRTFGIPVGHPAHIQALDVLHLGCLRCTAACGRTVILCESATNKQGSGRATRSRKCASKKTVRSCPSIETAENGSAESKMYRSGAVVTRGSKAMCGRYGMLFVGRGSVTDAVCCWL